MPRLLFSKTGSAIWISHLDLMRALQRGFRRAGFRLQHSQGFSPHPSLSIALPLSVGVSSEYELAEFALEDGETAPLSSLPARLNAALPEGIHILDCFDGGEKLKALKWLRADLTLEYDNGIPAAATEAISALFARSSLSVEKHGKNGPVTVDIIPMLHEITLHAESNTALLLDAVVSAQNPTLNPLLLVQAIETALPELAPDFSKCCRKALYTEQMKLFR